MHIEFFHLIFARVDAEEPWEFGRLGWNHPNLPNSQGCYSNIIQADVRSTYIRNSDMRKTLATATF